MLDTGDLELWDVDDSLDGLGAVKSYPFSIVVPLRVEAANVGKVLTRLGRFLNAVRWEAEIIAVDDGSEDGTAEACGRWKSYFKDLTVVRHGIRQGRGTAARTGTLLSKGEIVIVLDSRGDTPPEDAAELVGALKRGADVAIASRRLPGAETQAPTSFIDRASATTFTALSRLLVPVGVRDTGAEIIAMRRKTARRVAQRSRVAGDAFGHEWLALADRLGERVIEVPASNPTEVDENGPRRPNELAMLRDLWRMRRRIGKDQMPAPEAVHELLRQTSFVRVDRSSLAAGRDGRGRGR